MTPDPIRAIIAQRDYHAEEWIRAMAREDEHIREKVQEFIKWGWWEAEMSTKLVQAQERVRDYFQNKEE